MERIQNMLYDVRFINSADAENERTFLLEKAYREPGNSEPHEMLANLELHLAQEHNARAEDYALEAMRRNPHSSYAWTALSHAMGGTHVDPRNNTHNALIAHYKDFIKNNPDFLSGYAWLIAQLIDDNRLKEAQTYCTLMAQQGSSYFVTVQKIKLALAKRDIDTAKMLWEQMGQDYPENWSVHHWIGDFQAQTGDYTSAKESYRRSISLLPVPRFSDPIDSLAQVCEMDGDILGAIEARQLELEISEKEWGDTSGESVESILREIARLKKQL